jgi:hypothetical protein
MWTLLEDPMGRALMALLTTDHGLPGDPRREALLHKLQKLRIEAEVQGRPAQVRRAIRSALRSMRTEFPVILTAEETATEPAVNDDYAAWLVGTIAL